MFSPQRTVQVVVTTVVVRVMIRRLVEGNSTWACGGAGACGVA
jgi:hypothetical protein